jgi:predicted phage-related endonuclease
LIEIPEGIDTQSRRTLDLPHKNMTEVDNMSINEMESKARELRQLQSLIEEATAEAEALKDAIKAAMGDAEEIRAGEYRITWKSVTSSRLDTAALKKSLPEVAERFTKQTTTRRFCVA